MVDIRHAGQQAKERLSDALSSGALYTLLFASIIALFGSTYTMIISPIIVIFRTKRNVAFSTSLLGRILITLPFLNILSYIATLNIVCCIALNIIVPFLLVVIQSNQFDQKAYFGYVMAFVFLELIPHTPDEFMVQLASTVFATVVLVVVLYVTRWYKGRSRDPERELDESLGHLAELLDRLADGESPALLSQEFLKLEKTFDRLCFSSRKLFQEPNRTTLKYYLYATLFQRAIYLLSDPAWRSGREHDVDLSVFHHVAAMVRQVRAASTPAECAAVHRMLKMILSMVDLPEGRTRIFFHSVLHTLMLITSQAPERRRHLPWRVAPLRDIAANFIHHLDSDSFEFRFATRLSVVLVITCSMSMLWSANHVYWVPLNAFLLLMPSYEESTHRMRTRPLGTAIGCIVVFAASHIIHDPLAVYCFCMVMILLVYACTPGSWVQAIFATSFALMMTSLTIDETTAMALRLFYVLMAVGIVLVINYLVLPSKREKIFECNKRQLNGIIKAYWGFVERSVTEHVELRISGEMLSAYHLVYDEAIAYVRALDDEEVRDYEESRLVTRWHMFSELEQIEYLVQAGELDDEDLALVRHIALTLKDRTMPMSRSYLPGKLIPQIHSEDLRYALEHYMANRIKLT
ncbi:MAG TPA: FUSC family protein [Collinsella ihuae]|uniref:FUSC family protein n=1 Tax=Collinsella ihumii TaxID=1720204 RepID=A0A921IQM2_9ACTN|nr:FUSC family protein [Collinsella ihumii]